VLSLYRTILRGLKGISDSGTKNESRRFARDEFERHKDVKDLVSGIIVSVHWCWADHWTGTCPISTLYGEDGVGEYGKVHWTVTSVEWDGDVNICNIIIQECTSTRVYAPQRCVLVQMRNVLPDVP
jgi:hypothetical protein